MTAGLVSAEEIAAIWEKAYDALSVRYERATAHITSLEEQLDRMREKAAIFEGDIRDLDDALGLSRRHTGMGDYSEAVAVLQRDVERFLSIATAALRARNLISGERDE